MLWVQRGKYGKCKALLDKSFMGRNRIENMKKIKRNKIAVRLDVLVKVIVFIYIKIKSNYKEYIGKKIDSYINPLAVGLIGTLWGWSSKGKGNPVTFLAVNFLNSFTLLYKNIQIKELKC